MSDLETIIKDLRAQGEELHNFLETLHDDDWSRTTTFKDWSVNDVVQHLYLGDYMAVTSHTCAEEFATFWAQMQKLAMPLVEYTRAWLDNESGSTMVARWYQQFMAMCDRFAASDPNMRLAWAGPDMGINMFATARLMETWAHSWEIYDLLGVTPKPSDRIRHIATLGVKTYGWSFVNRKLEAPEPTPYVRLTAPSGKIWEWNKPQDDNRVMGDAVAFCQVVTQVRNIADTTLIVSGEPARQWMAIAQCFAGSPEAPPKPGTRV